MSAVRVAVGVVAAVGLHMTFCEWRTLAYAEGEGPDRRLLRVSEHRSPVGNAADWDRRDAELDRYDAAFLDCQPPPSETVVRCIEAHEGGADTVTARAVARVDCEGMPRTPAFVDCMRDAGFTTLHPPRWSFEILGPRFDGPFVREAGLYAEDWTGRPGLDRVLAAFFGVALPLGLVGYAAARRWRSARAATT